VFYALLLLAIKAGFLGIWLAIVIIPALFRFLIIVAERRANGLEVEAPGIELFSLGGNLWTLFPTVPIAALLVSAAIAANWGMAGQLVLAIGWLTIFPTIMAVLVITNSLLQSLNPQAWLLFIRSTGANYLYAPLILVLAACVLLLPPIVPLWLRLLLWLYLAVAFYSLVGGLVRETGLLNEVAIPDPARVAAAKLSLQLHKARARELNHAYALISRDNRNGGLGHLVSAIKSDLDPDEAWSWYFRAMLRWEHTDPALYFGQRYLGYLLDTGQNVKAVKLILRCRLQNASFRPLPEDFDAAIGAAEGCANNELAAALEKSR
jgi:hypothetical protein